MTTPEPAVCIRSGEPCFACRSLNRARRLRSETEADRPDLDAQLATAEALVSTCHAAELDHWGLRGRRWRKL